MTEKYWTVPRDWEGETAFIIAGGTSVADQDVSRLNGRRIVAVNSSYERAPFAQYIFFGDARWWTVHRSKPAIKNFQGKIVTCSRNVKDKRVLLLRRLIPEGSLGFAPQADAVCAQRTSLQGAMNMTAHLGAMKIVLLGADMQRGPDGKTHHHTPHKWTNKPGNETWDIQMEQLRLIVEPLQKRGIEVVNASPYSRIPYWPCVSFESLV